MPVDYATASGERASLVAMSAAIGAVGIPTCQVTLNGEDITSGMQVAALRYNEGVSHEVPRISVVMQDIDQRWQNYTFAIGQDVVALSLGYRGMALQPVGTFTIDGRGLAVGRPDQFTLDASEGGLGMAIRTRNSVAYEGKTLSQIAQEVAAKHGLIAVTKAVNPDPVFQRKTQRLETDLQFLARIANENAYDFTIRNDQLIFYSHVSLLAQAITSPTITRSMLLFEDCELRDQRLATHAFGKASVSYYHPYRKQLISSSAVNSSVQSTDEHKLVARYENGQQAELAAESNLLAANERTTVARLQFPGTLNWRAGNTVRIEGFGAWSRNTWLVYALEASMAPQHGYVTTIVLHAVTEGAGTSGQSIPSNLALLPTSPPPALPKIGSSTLEVAK